jgi:hypothetical protein
VLRTLEPPPGGLAQLRARIERDAGWPVGARRLQVVTAATLLLAFVTWAGVDWRGQRDTLPAEFDLVQMSLGLSAAPSEPLTIPAVHRVPLSTDQVVFYLIGSIQE